MDLRDYLRIFERRWAWIAGIFVVVFGLLFYWSFQQPSSYRAQTEILLEKVPEHPVYISDLVLLTKVYDRNTRIKLITKRPVLQRAVLLLKDHFKNARLEKTETNKPKNPDEPEKQDDPKKQGKPDYEHDNPNKEMDDAVGALSGLISVIEEPGVDIVTIACDDSQGDRAVLFANAVADAYVEYAVEMAVKGVDDAIAAAGKEMERETVRLNALRGQLASEPPSPAYETDRERRKDLQALIGDISSRLHAAREKLASGKADRAALEPLLSQRTLRYDPPPERLPRTSALIASLNRLDEQIASMRAGSTEADPRLQRLVSERARISGLIDDVRKEEGEAALAAYRQEIRRRVETLITDAQVGEGTIAALGKERADLNVEVVEVDKRLATPDPRAETRRRLEADIKRHEENVGKLELDKQKMEISRTYVMDGPVKILHKAKEPFAVAAASTRNLALFGLTALIAAIGGAFAMEYLNNKIVSEHDVKRYVNLPLYGSAIRIRNESERLLLNVAVRSQMAENFNMIGALIETYAQENSAKVFMIASSKAAEGKSTMSANLATALARGGKRVILIDADLRRAVLHRFFGTDNSKGLSDYLRYTLGKPLPDEAAPSPVELADILRPSGVENLSIIPSGTSSKNPVALLKSPGLHDLIVLAREQADIILVDVPPVNIAVDTLVLAPHVDGILMLVTAGETRKDEVTHAKRMIESANGRLIGCLLNKTSRQTGGYYHYYYYRQYKYYREP